MKEFQLKKTASLWKRFEMKQIWEEKKYMWVWLERRKKIQLWRWFWCWWWVGWCEGEMVIEDSTKKSSDESV